MWAARLLILGTLLVLLSDVEGKKKKKKSANSLFAAPPPPPLTEGEINDLLSSSPVKYMKMQGCGDDVDACMADPVCVHELKAGSVSDKPPEGGGALLNKLISCGNDKMAFQKVFPASIPRALSAFGCSRCRLTAVLLISSVGGQKNIEGGNGSVPFIRCSR
jgi:hypothetical protein